MSRRDRPPLQLPLPLVETPEELAPRPEGLARPEGLIICEQCGGAGWTSEADPCPACDGDGVVDNPDGPVL